MAFINAHASGDCVAKGRQLGGEAIVGVFIGEHVTAHLTPADARKLSADLLQAADAAEAEAAAIIKGNADIAQTAQVAV